MQNQIVLFKIKLCHAKSNCVIQNQIVLFKIKLCYSKSNCVIQNQIVLFKIKLCYAKSNCVIQNQIVLFKIKLCYSKSNCVIQNQIVLLMRGRFGKETCLLKCSMLKVERSNVEVSVTLVTLFFYTSIKRIFYSILFTKHTF